MVASVDSSIDTSALPRALRAEQAGGDGQRRRDAAHRIADRVTHAQRRRCVVAGDAHHAGNALDDLVVCRSAAKRAILAEARDGAVDKTRIHLAQHVVAEFQAVHHAGAIVFDQRIGLRHQLEQDRAPFRVFQVDGDGLLARIDGDERGAHLAARLLRIRPETAGEVAIAGHFDLDDFSAEQTQLIAAERPGQHVRQVEHAQTRERQSHENNSCYTVGSAPRPAQEVGRLGGA
jgi:hypothetical protein